MDFPYGDPITVITRTKSGVDEFGNDVFTEAAAVVTGAFAPAVSGESTDGRDTVVSQPQALLPYGTAVSPNSVLVIGGLRYEVDGTPNDWRNPFTGWQAGLAVPLRRVTG